MCRTILRKGPLALLTSFHYFAVSEVLPWPRSYSLGNWSSEESAIPRSVLQSLNGAKVEEIGRRQPYEVRRVADFQWLNIQDLNYRPQFIHEHRYGFDLVRSDQRISKCPGLTYLGDRKLFIRKVEETIKKKIALDTSILPKAHGIPQDLPKMQTDALFFLKSPDLHAGKVEVARNSNGAIQEFLKRMGEKYGPKTRWIAQDYVEPLLFDERKFHIRLFVLITSVDPLKIWMLTDWSYFELAHGNYSFPSQGSKIDFLKEVTNNPYTERERLKDIEADPARYWKPMEELQKLGEATYKEIIQQMKHVVLQTLLIVSPSMKREARILSNQRSCFELVGFDVLIDSKKKAKVLEINRSPSMAAHSEIKRAHKAALLGDVFCIGGIGCERASRNPGTIAADEADTLELASKELSPMRALKHEQRRAARTSAVQVWPDHELMTELEPVLELEAYEVARFFTERRRRSDGKEGKSAEL
jgi:hypothetical protein